MQRVIVGQNAALRISLLPAIRRVGGVADYGRIVDASACSYRVRTPSQTASTDWTAVSASFPLGSVTVGAASEGAVVLPEGTGGTGDFKYGDICLVSVGGAGSLEYLPVRVIGSDNGEGLRVGSPLPCDVEDASAVYNITVVANIDSSILTGVGLGVVEMRVTSGGVQYVFTEQFTVVRRVINKTMTPDRLQTLMPSVESLRESSDFTLQEAIDAAWDMELMPILSAKGVSEDNIRDTTPLEPAWVAAIALHLGKNNPSVDVERLDYLSVELDSKIGLALSSKLAWYLDDQTTAEPMPPDGGDGKQISFMRYTR